MSILFLNSFPHQWVESITIKEEKCSMDLFDLSVLEFRVEKSSSGLLRSENASLRVEESTREDEPRTDMTRSEFKRSIIVLVSLMAFERIISAEDDDDLALARINKLFLRYPRMIAIESENPTSRDFNGERELESRLSNLLEFRQRDQPAKLSVVREENEEIETTKLVTKVSPFVRFGLVNKRDEEDAKDEPVEDDSDENEKQETTISTKTHKNKHARLFKKIGQKLTDKNIKFTISLPVAIVVVGSIVLVTCCCALYLRNRLVACINTVTGRKKRKSKMLFVDSERGRSTPRSRKKSISSSKHRARSISQDMVNIATQKSSTTATTNENDEPSTTGCYRCCKKKKKRGNKNKK